MPIDFPNSPTAGDTYTVGTKTWIAGHKTTETRTNLLTNPSFETNTTGWNNANCTISRVTTDAYVGSACLQMVATNTSTACQIGQNPDIVVSPNTTYTMSAYVKNTAGATRNHRVQIRWALSGGGTSVAAGSTEVSVAAADGWVRLSTTATSPSDATGVDLLVQSQVTGGAIGNTTLVDACLIEATSTLRPYFDGSTADAYSGYTLIGGPSWTGTANASTSTATWGLDESMAWDVAIGDPLIGTGVVTSDKIADNAVTTAKIAAGAVVEADLGAGAVTADKIGTGAVTTAKIADANVTAAKLAATAAIQPTIVDAKGDLIVGTADNTVARQGVGVDGTVLMADSAQTNGIAWSSAQTSYRNLLINGAFEVWQRGTAVQSNSGQGAYASDRWCGAHQFQTSRTQRTNISSPPTGLLSRYTLRSSSATTAQTPNGSRMRIAQKLESVNSYRLRGQQVTLSFWVRFSNATVSSINNSSGGGSSAYGNFGYSIGSYTSTTDSATNTSAADVAINSSITNGSFPTTWTKYTLTGTVASTANNVDVVFGFASLGSTSSADTEWFEIAQVQLEAGSVATPFEFEDYGTTLAKCQRYYFEDAIQNVDANAAAAAAAANRRTHPTRMRSTPTISQVGSVVASLNTAATTFSVDASTSNDLATNFFITATAAGRSHLYRPVQFSAEL